MTNFLEEKYDQNENHSNFIIQFWYNIIYL